MPVHMPASALLMQDHLYSYSFAQPSNVRNTRCAPVRCHWCCCNEASYLHWNGRAQIYKLAQKGDWANNHKFYIGDRDDVKGDYSDLISRAKFCLVAAGGLSAQTCGRWGLCMHKTARQTLGCTYQRACLRHQVPVLLTALWATPCCLTRFRSTHTHTLPGDGWSSRLEDAVTHGCIPVIIFDEVHAVLESIVDFESFSVRIKEADVDRILEILQVRSAGPCRLACQAC